MTGGGGEELKEDRNPHLANRIWGESFYVNLLSGKKRSIEVGMPTKMVYF